MILLDTNVISELMRGSEANPMVLDWIKAQPQAQLALPSIAVMEVLTGVAILPAGRKREQLGRLAQRIFHRFAGRVLPFDLDAAVACAELAAAARGRGVAVTVPDAQIAAIAAVGSHLVASRDVTPYKAMGVRLINPWTWTAG